MSLKLYEIADQYREALSQIVQINEETGEVTFSEEAQRRMAQMEGSFEKKAEATAAVIKEIEKEAEAMMESARHQKSAAQLKQDEAVRLREYLYAHMQMMYEEGKRKVPSNLFSIYEQMSKRTEMVDLAKRDEIPEKYRKYSEWELNKTLAKQDIEAGIEVPNVRISRYGSLVIKERKKRDGGGIVTKHK